ncbi:MAG: hypothetical protein RLZZ156_1411 [Deinococcota bacterium]|jgi:hypothetical protein
MNSPTVPDDLEDTPLGISLEKSLIESQLTFEMDHLISKMIKNSLQEYHQGDSIYDSEAVIIYKEFSFAIDLFLYNIEKIMDNNDGSVSFHLTPRIKSEILGLLSSAEKLRLIHTSAARFVDFSPDLRHHAEFINIFCHTAETFSDVIAADCFTINAKEKLAMLIESIKAGVIPNFISIDFWDTLLRATTSDFLFLMPFNGIPQLDTECVEHLLHEFYCAWNRIDSCDFFLSSTEKMQPDSFENIVPPSGSPPIKVADEGLGSNRRTL